jgi:RNA polymerase sigma-70 factor (ECF subfamily)
MATSTSSAAREEIVRYLTDHRPAMTSLALRLTRGQAAAADLVQATAERALRKVERYRAGSAVGPWINAVMSRLFIDQRRRRSVEIGFTEQHEGGASPDPETMPCPWEWVTMADVRRAATHLSPAQRVVFELCSLDGLSYEETAMRLGIPLSTVGTRLIRARLQLRALLADGGNSALRLPPAPTTWCRASARRLERRNPSKAA